MSHVALQEMVDGRNVDWPEHVSDEQYRSQTAVIATASRPGNS